MKNLMLPRCTPESQGVASPAILQFVDSIEKNVRDLHSFMLLRHGAVVAEGWWSPYQANYRHMMFSLSKSFTSTAIGLAVAEGRLSLNDPLISIFPDETPENPSENLRAMRIKQLLAMCTGHSEDPTSLVFGSKNPNWVKTFLSLPVQFRPGTHFVYNTAATFMLSAIIQKVTGMKLVDYLEERLFQPLGIEGAAWDENPAGINMGGTGLNIKTEDIARFGQMLLQKGVWNGQQVVPAAWIAEATSRQVSNGSNPDSDWEQGYGYQFWRCRHGGYRGDGAFGQYCVVLPEQDAVLAITSGLPDMQAVLNIAWETLLPGMNSGPLPANSAAQEALAQKLSGLAHPTVTGQALVPLAEAVSGRRYQMEPNDLHISGASFEFSEGGCTLHLQKTAGSRKQPVHFMGELAKDGELACDTGTWRTFTSSLFAGGERVVAGSGAWTAENTYRMIVRLVHTPFVITITSVFNDDRLEMSIRQNVAFHPNLEVKLTGRKS